MEYCLYEHIRLDNNEVFYIGIGSKRRPYSKNSRSDFWKNIVNKSEFKVNIILESNDRKSLLEKEKEYIKRYGRRDLGLGTLVNLTDGGEDIAEKMLKRGRTKEHYDKMRGSKNCNAKITEEIARNIKLDIINKIKRSITLEKYNISKHLYKDIQRNKTWKHVEIL